MGWLKLVDASSLGKPPFVSNAHMRSLSWLSSTSLSSVYEINMDMHSNAPTTTSLKRDTQNSRNLIPAPLSNCTSTAGPPRMLTEPEVVPRVPKICLSSQKLLWSKIYGPTASKRATGSTAKAEMSRRKVKDLSKPGCHSC